MINKQSLWFLTLFSIILVLGVYYVAMPTNSLATIKENNDNVETINIENTDILAALRIENEEQIETTMNELNSILLSENSTIEEKNKAYEEIKNININKGKEEEIEEVIKESFKYHSFVKIKKDTISITISNKTHDKKLANEIIRKIQSLYNDKMYITVKFQ
jgi:stage III sporulation protein AH